MINEGNKKPRAKRGGGSIFNEVNFCFFKKPDKVGAAHALQP